MAAIPNHAKKKKINWQERINVLENQVKKPKVGVTIAVSLSVFSKTGLKISKDSFKSKHMKI